MKKRFSTNLVKISALVLLATAASVWAQTAAPEEQDSEASSQAENIALVEKVAILPFVTRAEGYTAGRAGGQLMASTVSEDIRGSFNKLFTQSRRFAVLTREDAEAIAAEKQEIRENSPVEELAKIGRQLGCDYLVVGTIRNFYIAPLVEETLGLTGRKRLLIAQASIDLDYRIIGVASSQILWSDQVAVDLTQAEINELQCQPTLIYRELLDRAGRQLAWGMINNIYPPRALQLLSTGEVVLDIGGDVVRPGDCFDAFALGEELYSASTDEPLGRAELYASTYVIERTDAKMSYAIPLQDRAPLTAEQVASGVLFRPSRAVAPANQPSPVPPPPQEKPPIYLPFD